MLIYAFGRLLWRTYLWVTYKRDAKQEFVRWAAEKQDQLSQVQSVNKFRRWRASVLDGLKLSIKEETEWYKPFIAGDDVKTEEAIANFCGMTLAIFEDHLEGMRTAVEDDMLIEKFKKSRERILGPDY